METNQDLKTLLLEWQMSASQVTLTLYCLVSSKRSHILPVFPAPELR